MLARICAVAGRQERSVTVVELAGEPVVEPSAGARRHRDAPGFEFKASEGNDPVTRPEETIWRRFFRRACLCHPQLHNGLARVPWETGPTLVSPKGVLGHGCTARESVAAVTRDVAVSGAGRIGAADGCPRRPLYVKFAV